MKKLSLLFAFLMIVSPAMAGTLTLPSYLSGNDVTIANLESSNNSVETWANGNVESINIKDGTITTSDLAQAVSTVTRWDESFNDYTVSGMLPATSANLTSDISAGTSYVDGYRVVQASVAHTYTASKDTYIYCHRDGYYIYEEVANGAVAPSTPTSSLLLAKVVTDGSKIASVTDSRTLSIQITATTSNFPVEYIDGCGIVRDSTTAVHMEAGNLAVGTTIYANAADTAGLSTATSGNWIEGTVPNLNNQKFFVYAYNTSGSALGIKYCSADPVYADTSDNTGKVLRYYKSGSTYYRALAWISADSSGQIQTWNMGNLENNKAFRTYVNSTTGTTGIPYDDTIPQISEGDEYMNIPFRALDPNKKLRIDVVMNAANASNQYLATALFQNTTAGAIASTGEDTSGAGRLTNLSFTHYMTVPDTNVNIFRVRAGADSGTTTFNGVGGARYYGGVLTSSISVTEE